MTSFTQRDLSPLHVGNQPLRVNRAEIEYGMQRQLVYYWFQQRGRVVTNEYLVKWYLLLDSIRIHRTDGALVRLVVGLRPDQTASEADQELTEFTAAVLPKLDAFVPD
jgi:EpsI family protein